MVRLPHRPLAAGSAFVALGLALGVTLGGCTPQKPPRPAARAPGPYDVPGADQGAPDRGPPGPIPVTSADPTRGDPLAPVTIVEFADFQCPFCQRGALTLMELQREYGPARIRVAWKNYPLPFHQHARGAAEAGVVLFKRVGPDAFWKYHDNIVTSEQGLGRALFDDAIVRAGWKPEDVRLNLRDGAAGRKVDEDAELGRQLGVTGTPAFFVNGVRIHGAQPIEKFRPVIDAQLEAARAAAAAGTPPERIYAQLTAQSFVPPPPPEAAGDDPVDVTVYRVPVGASPSRGPKTAPITIVEFADFQCPYCTRAEESLRQVSARYGDKVRLVWKHLPLPFHKRAQPAAELAAEALAQKGEAGFWKAHDLLLAQNGKLDDDDLASVARAAGLDPARAAQALAQHRHLAAVEEDEGAAEEVEASGTPTFFVNGRKLVGAQPFSAFQAVIDEQLPAAEAALARGVAPAALYDTLQAGAKVVTPDAAPVAPVPTAENPSRGPQGAKVVVQIWSDLECPFCRRVEPTLSQLEAAFPGKLRFVWHNLPLSIHAHAMAAAEAAMEAFAQKGAPAFWKMHDLILDNQGEGGLEKAALEKYAAGLGLNLPRFRSALESGIHRPGIVADMKAGAGAGLTATPGFVINGYRLSGALPLSRFKRVVRRALSEAK